MSRFFGLLKSKAQATTWAKRIRAGNPGDTVKAGAASLLETNWQYVAARPALAAEMFAMSETKSISVDRPGSVLNRLMAHARGGQ